MITKLKTTLIDAGIKNSSMDCSIPVNEKASPVHIIVGSNIYNNLILRFKVCSSKPSAKNDVICLAKIKQSIIIAVIKIDIQLIKTSENSNAFCSPSLFILLLNIGIKLDVIADANIASKSTLGILLAVKKALEYILVPY